MSEKIESQISVTRQIISFLRARKKNGIPVWWANKPDGLRVIAMGRGGCFIIKATDGKLTKTQWATIDAIREAGGYCEVVRSLRDFRVFFGILLGE